MKNIVRTIILLFLIIIIIMFRLFYQNQGVAQINTNETISLILSNANDDFWINLRQGAEVAAKEFNAKLNIYAPKEQNDVLEQIDLINEEITKKPDAIIIGPADCDRIVNSVVKATESGIDVFAVDSDIKTDSISSYIGSNNLLAGEKVGEKLVEYFGTNNEIAVINSTEKSINNEIKRGTGLIKYMNDYENNKLFNSLESFTSVAGAKFVTNSILTSKKNISVIVALNYVSTIGAAEAVEELGLKNKISIIGFDSDSNVMHYMDSGIIKTVIVQSPFTMGYLAVKNAVLKHQGVKIPRYIETGFSIVDSSNMYSQENEKILFPFKQ